MAPLFFPRWLPVFPRRMRLLQLVFVSLSIVFSRVQPSPSEVQCVGSTCLALYWTARSFHEASDMCEGGGGRLLTLRSKATAKVVIALMRGRPRSVWLDLATSDNHNLFQTEAASHDSGPYCMAVTRELRWRACTCQDPTDGFLCVYVYPDQTCAPLSLPPPATAAYFTPFGARGEDLMNLPKGTLAELPPGMGGPLECSLGGTWGRDLPGAWDCHLENGGCEGQCGRDDQGQPFCACPKGSALREEDWRSCQHSCVAWDEPGVCLCSEGFAPAPDGQNCVDVDECQATPGPCKQECLNTPGSFKCRCFPGYELVAGNCEENTQRCFDLACPHECVWVRGEFTCACFKGYMPDPEKPHECVLFCDQAECPPQCDPHTGESCECPEGFDLATIEDGTPVCVDIEECELGYCGLLDCINAPGSYSCICPNQ